MGREFLYWEITGFIVTVVLGTLLHFAYQWSGKSKIVGLFAPVNESTWEHLKLLFVPMTLFTAAEYFPVGWEKENFIAAKAVGILIGMFTILVIFYTYTGISGKNYLWADIVTFILGVAAAFGYAWFKMDKTPDPIKDSNLIGLTLILVIVFCFACFTFDPPRIALFRDPVSGRYGIADP
ncbi:hypothetical protein CAFE_25200 [Caprobacter fermentans]|uniref:Uncharacterized protein n=1 Tax=Caproicibacter fermentans TaxID=2576756 RepID=A0A6N8I1Q1_9FIRM|nr:DUF6512 family protein [Caproicibacter fermentans]MVB11795.1 hypothetical protein [Caproicibacter fermentans]QNK41723.1 hypothetical protein HCR03_05600 [Caproicibacter fermentans]